MIKKIFGFIYKILSYVNLQPALFTAVIGAILFLTGVFKAVPALLMVFYLALIICFIYAIIATIKAIFGIKDDNKKEKDKDKDKNKNKNKNQPVQIIEPNESENSSPNTDASNSENAINSQVSDSAYNGQGEQKETPRYYRVKQNPNMVMAEYSNRYELYKIENQKLIKVRTDYK